MSTRIQQKGAALVIGLMLLAILTLLAITGMNTATTELTMAGNEQFHQNAFAAAETGIEQGMSVLSTMPQGPAPPTVVAVVGPTAVPGSPTDQYTVTTTYEGEDDNIPGFSAGKFVGFHYEIASVGASSRNAAETHVQGAFVVQAAGGS